MPARDMVGIWYCNSSQARDWVGMRKVRAGHARDRVGIGMENVEH